MMIMSLRDGDRPSKQSPVSGGDCFATCARNDIQENAFPLTSFGDDVRGLQSTGGEELSAFEPREAGRQAPC